MKRILLGLILITSCSVSAQNKTAVVYDNHAQVRNVPSFTAISVSSAIDLYLTQSNTNKVAVSASEEEIRDKIITEVVGGTLIIRLGDNGTWFSWKKWGNYKTKAYVSIKDIDANTIKSINVLKGETAAKLYGEKGKNGVIEIITKKN